jgi:hypothetical protein
LCSCRSWHSYLPQLQATFLWSWSDATGTGNKKRGWHSKFPLSSSHFLVSFVLCVSVLYSQWPNIMK